jgi:hypothetical protein
MPNPTTAPATMLPKVVILKMLLGVTFPNVVVVSLIVTRVIGLFVFRYIDDLVERAAFNESQKTFQQMSQKDALQLAKDVYEFDLKSTYGGYAKPPHYLKHQVPWDLDCQN